MDCHRATGPQHHLQLGNLLQPRSFSPPPHLPQPFTISSSHHIFMKLCAGGVCSSGMGGGGEGGVPVWCYCAPAMVQRL